MKINSINIFIDLAIGILEFIVLAIFFVKTEKYSIFQPSYYYYLLVSPCFGLLELFKILLFKNLNTDITQTDFISFNNSDLSINRRSQILKLFQLLILSLSSISPTLIELMFGILSIIIKYSLTKNVSVNDIYFIHSLPTFLSVIFLIIVKSYFPSPLLLDDVYNPCIYFGIIINILIGTILNTLVLISGGLIGLSICNSYLL